MRSMRGDSIKQRKARTRGWVGGSSAQQESSIARNLNLAYPVTAKAAITVEVKSMLSKGRRVEGSRTKSENRGSLM